MASGVLSAPTRSSGLAKTLTGILGLDEITRGGLPKGRPTLVCGGPGSGKTLLAADGVSGLELLNAERPDVGIIEIGLPRMDGYQVARRIRDLPHGRDMLLLALSGYGSPSDAKRSVEHGFDHHLVKPVDPDYLTNMIHKGAEAT